MILTLEFADSEIASVVANGDTLQVRFSAACAVEARTQVVGFVQGVELAVHGATWPGNLGLCFGRLSSGRVIAGSVPAASVAIPFQSGSPVSVELVFRNGESLLAQGQSVAVVVNGPLSFIESYAC